MTVLLPQPLNVVVTGLSQWLRFFYLVSMCFHFCVIGSTMRDCSPKRFPSQWFGGAHNRHDVVQLVSKNLFIRHNWRSLSPRTQGIPSISPITFQCLHVRLYVVLGMYPRALHMPHARLTFYRWAMHSPPPLFLFIFETISLVDQAGFEHLTFKLPLPKY